MRILARRSLAAAALVGAIVSTTAACGGSTGATQKPSAATGSPSATAATAAADPYAGKTGTQIVTTAESAMEKADSIRLAGTISEHGSKMTVDTTMGKGSTCKAGISMGSQGTVDIVEIGPTVWMKYEGALLKSMGQAAALVKNKYIKAAKSDPSLSDFASFCDLGTFARSGTNNGDTYTKGRTSTVDGQQVLTVLDNKDKSVVLMSLATPYRIVRLDAPPTAGGYLDVTYNVPGTIVAPPASEVIDGSKYGL